MGIREKIEKLLALAGNNPSREEAEAAMLKAQRLLAREGLEEGALQDVRPEVEERSVTEPGRRVPWWQRRIAEVVAPNFRCGLYYRFGGRYRRVVLVGRPEHLAVARHVHLLAVRTAAGEARRFLRRERELEPDWSASLSRRLRNDFLRGYVDGLRDSFRAQVRATGTALALRRPPEVGEHLDRLGLVPSRRPRPAFLGCPVARAAGESTGRRFSYTPPLGVRCDDP